MVTSGDVGFSAVWEGQQFSSFQKLPQSVDLEVQKEQMQKCISKAHASTIAKPTNCSILKKKP